MDQKAIGSSNSLQETFLSVAAIILLMFLWIQNTYQLPVRRVKTGVESYVQLIQATFYISIFIIGEKEFHISQICKGSS
jgi:low affinity Fe/Cu permease